MIIPEWVKLSTVKNMLPEEVMGVVKLHNPKSYQQLRDIIREEIKENCERQQDVKSKHAHALSGLDFEILDLQCRVLVFPVIKRNPAERKVTLEIAWCKRTIDAVVVLLKCI